MNTWRVIGGVVSDKTMRLIRVRKREVVGERVKNCFYPGDIVASDKDLRVHNQGGTRRFEFLGDEPIPNDPSELSGIDNDLDAMTVVELKAMAEGLELDMTSLNKKADIIDAIREAEAIIA